MPIFSFASRNAWQRLKFEQRERIRFCVKTKISVKQTFQMLQQVYGSKAMSRSRCKDWYLRFKNGRTSVDDEMRSGRRSKSTTPRHIREIDQLVHQDLRLSMGEISAILNVSFGTVQAILTSTLNLHQVANKFVPRLLTPELKQHRLQASGPRQNRTPHKHMPITFFST
uniref:Mos1 transposase HTH domain-containing protein n=1 Tax=Neolamprologus brichardi TaxID=32507 RepID=A0A3Q4NB84_NEOBR